MSPTPRRRARRRVVEVRRMEIIDLSPEYHGDYFNCLEDWSKEIEEAGDHKACWFNHYKVRGLRVKLAMDEQGVVGGMIQYLPIEASFVDGQGLYMVLCIWVHGHRQGRGNFQGRGMGSALLQAAEDDARERGAKGMAAWGLWLPFWMRADWFRKHGYRKADRMGLSLLVWKPFAEDALPPRWIRRKKRPSSIPGKVTVTAFINGWCTAQNMTFERARRASETFGDKVVFRAIDTSRRETMLEWGISDALFIDDKPINTGPPPSYEKLRRLIARRVGRLD